MGGEPIFHEQLFVGRPNIGDRERLLARINDMLDRRIADYLGVKHCIAMCNATIALEIAIRAAGLKGEVILPSMTFIATAHALQWQ
jgi:dTDP-4-amino-4,6-dideoxygalactose transaminase